LNTTPSILVGCENRVVWVKVEGKGSFQNSGGLKEFAQGMIARGERTFVVDLHNCPVMDSTFMGTLTGIALNLRELGDGIVHIQHPNERNADLLMDLGLDQLLKLDGKIPSTTPGPKQEDEELPVDRVLTSQSRDKTTQAETMLTAHEALVEAAPENLVKFKDVLEYLRQDLGR